ncbi:MAG: hypothetical protein FI737_03180 [SAR202 cluster bacterium]|jgi:hypothetical protein|nr:hypothetical protein [Dehalococcoidia bacterium]MQF88080.1 hypothetical protein [SAR202 cluster bacterium]|tara:strand:- start:6730 stop:7062 length:333 start_codon:yes stop_codon:yes gene_type:complete
MVKKRKPTKDLPFDRVVYRIEESPAGAGYEALCPELVISGFGDTAEEAKTMLRRQVSEYLEDCEKLEILEGTLIEAGFYFNGEVWMSNEVEPVGEPKIRFLGRPAEQASE